MKVLLKFILMAITAYMCLISLWAIQEMFYSLTALYWVLATIAMFLLCRAMVSARDLVIIKQKINTI